MMPPVIVSFYTVGTAYEAEAREMEETARTCGFATDVRGVPNLGSWVANCAMKPAYIRDRMQDHPGRPIVWLDADARIRRYPSLFNELAVDFACHFRHGAELLSGTLYFGPTAKARALVETWTEAQLRAPGAWDQKALQSVIEGGAVEGLTIQHLPASYTAIFDGNMCPEDEWVISHHQASRRLARKEAKWTSERID
jgi:hypothetical protein